MDITVIRTGRVQYKAGYEFNRTQIGPTLVYRTARVEELSTGTVLYYPPTALARTTDGGLTLPVDLLAEVVWEAAP